MAEKTTRRAPVLSGEQTLAMRKKAGANQNEFWSPVGITQSGGSRYESGRNIPVPVRLLLLLKYGTPAQKAKAEAFMSGDAL